LLGNSLINSCALASFAAITTSLSDTLLLPYLILELAVSSKIIDA